MKHGCHSSSSPALRCPKVGWSFLDWCLDGRNLCFLMDWVWNRSRYTKVLHRNNLSGPHSSSLRWRQIVCSILQMKINVGKVTARDRKSNIHLLPNLIFLSFCLNLWLWTFQGTGRIGFWVLSVFVYVFGFIILSTKY